MNVAILSNMGTGLVVEKTMRLCNLYTPAGYGVWMQELLDESSPLYTFNPSVIFVLLDAAELFRGRLRYEDCRDDLEHIKTGIASAVARHANVKFFISDFDFLQSTISVYKSISPWRLLENAWYQYLAESSTKFPNMYLFGIKELADEAGRGGFYSDKMWYMGGIKYSLKAQNLIAEKIKGILVAHDAKRKKCLLLDLDNTLWGGVVGELGPSKIELSEYQDGARYKDFQRRIKEIKDTGIILGVVSKNNLEDAMEVINGHEHMILRGGDFAIKKINWSDKSHNIREIASELNIGLNSIVFIDDNPVERENVRQLLPEVAVPDFPDDSYKLGDFIKKIWREYFFALDSTAEDQNKTLMYQQNAERVSAMQEAASIEDFLKSLQMRITIWKAQPEDIERVAQLTQKTNQFNLTTKRYTVEDITSFVNSPDHDVFVASVEDRFGDNGKVIVMIIRKDSDAVEIDTFLMSCRVMGRKIEDQFLGFITSIYQESSCKVLKASYIPTAKNVPVKDLYEGLGFAITKDVENNKSYEWDLKNTMSIPEYASIVFLD